MLETLFRQIRRESAVFRLICIQQQRWEMQSSRYYFALQSMTPCSMSLPTKIFILLTLEVFICACLEQGVIRQDVEGKRYAELGVWRILDDVQSYDAYVQFSKRYCATVALRISVPGS